MKKIGIIGCGAIGTALIEHIFKNLKKHVSEVLVWDVDSDRCETLNKKYSSNCIALSMADIIEKSDLIVEAAAPVIVPEFLERVIDSSKDAIIMSIGGLLGHEELLDTARGKNIKVFLPSGAISGIDALKSFSIAGIEEVTITTRKPLKGIKGAPFLEENKINIDKIFEETTIFDGNATDAIKGFPKNINVSALLSIVGIGAEETKVKIIVSPNFSRNSHEIKVISKAGEMLTQTINVPSPENPKTSYLAALAAMSTINGYFDSVRVGT